jgi:hypothetical protein
MLPRLGLLFALFLPQEAPAPARPERLSGFRYTPGRLEPGTVYRYRKSNLDGTNASEIALRIAAEDRLAVLKWHRGEPEATLVEADLDWEVCSVSALRSFRVDQAGARTSVAELRVDAARGELVLRIGGREVTSPLETLSWHSYDFDFSSLNVALRFLEDPEGEVEFDIVDPVPGPAGPAFASKGRVFLSYAEDQERAGLPCRVYALDGPGLEQRGGRLWVHRAADAHIVAFEIDLPDEPGMSSGKLEWIATEWLAPAEWERFLVERGQAGRPGR